MDVGHRRLLSGFSLTGLAKPIKIELMIGHLIACGLPHLHRPIRDVTKVQFDDTSALLTDDVVMVILQLTKFILNRRPVYDFEDDSQGFKKIKRSIDGGKSNLPLASDHGSK
jgi:hypothetical protein